MKMSRSELAHQPWNQVRPPSALQSKCLLCDISIVGYNGRFYVYDHLAEDYMKNKIDPGARQFTSAEEALEAWINK